MGINFIHGGHFLTRESNPLHKDCIGTTHDSSILNNSCLLTLTSLLNLLPLTFAKVHLIYHLHKSK